MTLETLDYLFLSSQWCYLMWFASAILYLAMGHYTSFWVYLSTRKSKDQKFRGNVWGLLWPIMFVFLVAFYSLMAAVILVILIVAIPFSAVAQLRDCFYPKVDDGIKIEISNEDLKSLFTPKAIKEIQQQFTSKRKDVK